MPPPLNGPPLKPALLGTPMTPDTSAPSTSNATAAAASIAAATAETTSAVMASHQPSSLSSSPIPTLSKARVPTPSGSSSARARSAALLVQHELITLSRDPVPFIYVHADESNVTKLSALIMGPLETPYSAGFFRFEMRVLSEYPMKPPRVSFQTTDGHRVRFNPNLYDDGKVCLSILGTWSGPAWSSAESLSTVLLSIQSLMCPDPYLNEPGFSEREVPVATKQAYNDYIRYETLRVAVVQAVKHYQYDDHFRTVYQRLFLLWFNHYLDLAAELSERCQGKPYSDPFSARSGVFNVKPIIDDLHALKKEIWRLMMTIDIPRPPAYNPVVVDTASTTALPPLGNGAAASSNGSSSSIEKNNSNSKSGSGSSKANKGQKRPAGHSSSLGLPVGADGLSLVGSGSHSSSSSSSSPGGGREGGRRGGGGMSGVDMALALAMNSDGTQSSYAYATDRLHDEWRHLMKHPHPGGSGGPRDPSHPFVWEVTILGPENTPWEGGIFPLELRFSARHPHMPPFARFTCSMPHPNITADGVPALDIIQTRWSPTTKIGTVLDQLQIMLKTPSPMYPVNQDAATLYRENRKEYERRARRMAQDGVLG